MKKLSKLKLKSAEMTPNEIKQILGGFTDLGGSGSSDGSGSFDGSGDDTLSACNGITGSCETGCKNGCSQSCQNGCQTNK